MEPQIILPVPAYDIILLILKELSGCAEIQDPRLWGAFPGIQETDFF